MIVSVCEQSFSNTDLVDEEPVLIERERLSPQWKCYAKHISTQQVLLIFLPATYTGNANKTHNTHTQREHCVSHYLINCLLHNLQHIKPN